MRNLARELTEPGSFPRFCRFMFGDWLRPFHMEWAELFGSTDEALVLGPRGHRKSTILCQAFPIWILAGDPNERIILLSNAKDEAVKDMIYIKGQLDNNERLLKVFPYLKLSHHQTQAERRKGGKTAQAEHLYLSGTTRVGEPSITSHVVFSKKVMGKHYTRAICGDVVGWENAKNETQRDKLDDWLGQTFEGALLPGATTHWVGTRYHHMDLYGRLIGTDEAPGELHDRHIVSSAINYDKDGNEVALFPEAGWTLKELHKRRRRMGTPRFNAQFQNDVRAMMGAVFKPDHITYWKQLPAVQELIKVIAMDTSVGKTITSDYTAWGVGVIDRKTLNKYLLEANRDKLNYDQRKAMAKDLVRRHPDHVRFGVEAVGFANDFVSEMVRVIPTMVGVDQSYSKEVRAQVLVPELEAQRLQFPGNGAVSWLENEMFLFPEGAHDDGVDMLEIMNRLLNEVVGIGDTLILTGGSLKPGARRGQRRGQRWEH